MVFIWASARNLQRQSLTRHSQLDTINPNGPPAVDRLLFISLGFGFSLAVTAWVFYRISGGLFNPAVTLGMVYVTLPTRQFLTSLVPEIEC